jgi:GAF domain-containing protein/HAMP domain-containing protein
MKQLFKKLNLGLKMNLMLVVVFGILLIAIVALLNNRIGNLTLKTGQRRVEQEVAVVQSRFGEVEREILANAKLLAITPRLVEAVTNRDASGVRTAVLIGAAPLNLDDIEVVDADGERIMVVIEEGEVHDKAQEDALLSFALLGIEATGSIVEAKEGEELEFRLAAVVPVHDVTGAVIGALLASREIDDETLAEINFSREDVSLTLLQEGQMLARSWTEEDYLSTMGEQVSAALLDRPAIGQALDGQALVAGDLVSVGDVSYALAYAPLTVGGETKVVLGHLVNLNELAVFQRQLTIGLSMAISIFTLAAIGAVILFLRQNVTLPLHKLRSVAMWMAKGDYQRRAEVTTEDEIGRLATDFNSMAIQLEDSIRGLEQRVADRTEHLRNIVILTERLSNILDLDELLAAVVNQTQEYLGYYHAHIYLLDDEGQNLVVAAGTGAAGEEMKAEGYNIPLNASISLIARAARSGKIVSIDNVHEAEDFLPYSLLPDTCAEMAVPIILSGQVIGVLDVQEDKTAGLDEGDASLLRSLANQVAVAIRNARLLAEIETSLAEVRATQERYIEQSWQKAKLMTRQGQYHYARPDTPALDEADLDAATGQALAQNRPAIVTINDEDQDSKPESIVAPVIFQNKSIGALQLHPASYNQTWTEDDLAVVEAVADQLAQSAESLRLFEGTRERAGREQALREITEKMQAADNLEELIKTTAQELGQYFSPEYAAVELGIEAESPQSGPGLVPADNGSKSKKEDLI